MGLGKRGLRVPLCLWLPAVLIAALAFAPASSAAPTCAEGPQTVGDTIFGTPCDDTIRPPRGVTTVFGEGGNDALYGGRGNDSLFGGEGVDRLYGGIGDDRLRGGQDDDRLSGGFGADSLDGEAGNDFARGDATIDAIDDSGGGTDTLSYATGATPGFFDSSFPQASEYDQFPSTREGRGAFIGLGAKRGDNGLAPVGGGVDEEVEGPNFEVVIGSAFPDVIVGTADAETIYGGGGGDVLIGGGGADLVYGGADGDSCTAATTLECESSGKEVDLRDPGAIAVGSMAPQPGQPPALYLAGSDEDDDVTATYAPGAVTFSLGAGSDGGFDASPSAAGGCAAPAAGKVVCTVADAPDSVLLAGLDGNDSLVAAGFPESTSVILLGGNGADSLTGGATEDALVDGPGNDTTSAAGGDDAVPNNEGGDDLDAGPGEDLFVSNAICDGDVLDGGPDRDNANWANFNSAVVIDMSVGKAGLVGANGQPSCPTGSLTSLGAIEDIEGTSLADTLIGDPGSNQLLGRLGLDTYFAAAGDDSILANSGDADLTIDCGSGFDTAQVDHPNYQDPAPVECESIYERDPNSFRPPDTPPDPDPETPPGPTPESPAGGGSPPLQPVLPLDQSAPSTAILRRPPGRLFTSARFRRVVFAFGSDEAGVGYRCKLDGGPFRPCTSPRAYRLRLGRHALRVFAVDSADNRDPSPVLLRVRIVRR